MYSPWGRKESDTTEQLSVVFGTTFHGVAFPKCLIILLEFLH